MPNTFCQADGCGEVVPGKARYCTDHTHIHSFDKRRAVFDAQFYGTSAWKRLRQQFRRRHPICNRCRRRGAEHVHHKIPRRIRPDLSLSWSNLESLCASCHAKEHARSNGEVER